MDLSSPDRITDSRRLMGPNLFSGRAGAVLAVSCSDGEREGLLDAWRRVARRLHEALGWRDESILVRAHPGGAQCFTSAPIDALLAATEVNEQAWRAAERGLDSGEEPALAELAARVRVHVQHEVRPALRALHLAAVEREVSVSVDDEAATVGTGTGALSYPLGAIPPTSDIPWALVHDVPVALVTGSNGKTTTTRLVAAMLAAGGHTTGLTSTDGVWIDGAPLATGDYSGPAGARLVVRDPRVTAVVLETARGGMLRRGLAVTRATVAVVTNVAADHMGEYGIVDLPALGEVKLIVAQVVHAGGRIVLNADDPTLVALAAARAHTMPAPITWFSLDAGNEMVLSHVGRGGEAVVVSEGEVHRLSVDASVNLGAVTEMPLTLGGMARFNIANILAASAAALAMGVPPACISQTLRTFGARAADNPGRLTLLAWRGATVVVDFAHNPDGWRALTHALASIPAKRRIVLVGQAGDRDDEALDALAAAVWESRPDVVVLKEMASYLRGRALGDISDRLAAAFLARGLPHAALRRCASESEAVEAALAACRPGDLVVLTVHDDHAGAMSALHTLGAHEPDRSP